MASDRQIPKNLLPIPFLSKPEVKSGAILGRGSFCKVSVVKSLTLQQFFGNAPQEEARTHLNQRLISAGTSCAIKELKDFKSKSVLTRAEEDLKRELQILKGIHKNAGREAHPHIIELYAIGVETLVEAEAECETSPTFLILSKIDCTLKDILKTWRQERGFGFREMMGINIKKSRDLWLDRIILISKITDAIQFLHDRCIIYRDLKPDNIGVDGDSVPKLFDFGLAKKMESPSLDSNDTYQLTGNTGTLRYMAPEVGKNMGYNMGVDVYSLAIIMYEVISLKVPFGNINTPGQLRESVFENGLRPPIDQGWPLHFQSLLRQMWDADPKARPKSGAVHKTIEKMLRGRDTELFPIQMFSTYSDT